MAEKGIETKVLTIKQIKDGYATADKTLSGIIRIESEDCYLTIFASFINFRALISEEYKLVLINGDRKIKIIDLSSRPLAFTKTLEDFYCDGRGFMAGVCACMQDVPLLIALGKTENFEISIFDFKKIIYEKFASIQKTKTKKPTKIPCETKNLDTKEIEEIEIETSVVSPETVYNDEVVATENYYVKDYKPSIVRVENDESFLYEDVLPNRKNQTKKEESNPCGATIKNENDTSTKNAHNENCSYYQKAKRELEEVFSRFPKDESLERIFPHSKWSKVYYEHQKYYVVGLIKENDVEKYICYGVPCDYSPVAPKELKDYCQFIPLSIFDLTGKGYWMMFQDANTGECVKKVSAGV